MRIGAPHFYPYCSTKMAAKLILDAWVPWSAEALAIPYKSVIKGIGHGEHRLAHILGTKPLGQNVSYDLNLTIPSLHSKGEIKELDAAQSFKSGKSGRDLLRPMKQRIIQLQLQLATIQGLKELGPLHEDIEVLVEMSPDEICDSNLKRLKKTCGSLSTLRASLVSGAKMCKCFHVLTGKPLELSSSRLYKMLETEAAKGLLGPEQYQKEFLLDHLHHPYIEAPLTLTTDLNGIHMTMFKDITLLFVDEKKGYYIMSEGRLATHLQFNRITMGYPRFKLV